MSVVPASSQTVPPAQHQFFYTMPRGRKWDQIGKFPTTKYPIYKYKKNLKQLVHKKLSNAQWWVRNFLTFRQRAGCLYIYDESYDDTYIAGEETGEVHNLSSTINRRGITKFNVNSLSMLGVSVRNGKVIPLRAIGYWCSGKYFEPVNSEGVFI
jgi:hypothetical protein